MMNRAKNHFSIRWVPALVVLLLAVLLVSVASAADWDAEARSMLTLINDFRTGGNAWYWNNDNTTWTTETGLVPMEYDLELEKIAKVRAAEISVYFSHTRPDGSKWSTAFPSGNYYKAENICYGFSTAADAFTAFAEEDENYAGQGHRRIMLKSTLTRVGIAAVEVNGTVYWVQEFASGKVKSSLTSDSGWVNEGGSYVYVKDDGSRATGWLEDGGSWYYLNAQGVMQTGWQQISGDWYYFDNSGAMQTGWVEDQKDWYWFDDSGVMQTGWQQIKGIWYFMDDDGILQTGWFEDGGSWYYANKSGVLQTGWQEIQGSWYYFRSSGAMVTGTQTINGQKEYFDAGGVWQYSELPEYDTPLGPDVLNMFLDLFRECFRYIFQAFL